LCHGGKNDAGCVEFFRRGYLNALLISDSAQPQKSADFWGSENRKVFEIPGCATAAIFFVFLRKTYLNACAG